MIFFYVKIKKSLSNINIKYQKYRMVYIGYSLSLKEALRLCKLESSYSADENYYQYENDGKLKVRSFLQTYHLDLYGLDKGVYVIGIHLDVHLHHMSVDIDELMITLIKSKKRVKACIELAKIDLSRVEIETDLESDPIIVEYPEPYFINYDA